MIEKRRCWLACMILLSAATVAAAHGSENLFPQPHQLDAAVRFWTRVYTQIDTDSGYIHDAEHLGIIYQTVRFESSSHRTRRNQVEHAVRRYRDILEQLGGGDRTGLGEEAQRVLALWPKGTSNAEFRHAAHQLRFQLGQADRFRAGLERAGKWKQYIEHVLQTNGLPLELAALPHVESSFDPDAYSKVGAAGLWQFTRSTGLRYMRIDRVVDERRDPYLSTKAAVQLLKDNYDVLQTWPLAITAYNHGQAGMRRAVSQLGTTNIGVIVEKYQSRTFGFASRNFYAAFLAALDVDEHPQKYFGDIDIAPPLETIVTPVPDYVNAGSLAQALGIRLSVLQRLNPALTEAVWHGDKFVPKNFPLRLPGSEADDHPGTLLAAIPPTERYASQQPDVQHRVRRGETLSLIADEYHVSLASLVRINGLSDSDFIRAGQVLALPVRGKTPAVTLAAADGEGPAAHGEYVVRRGDSLDRIAKAFNVDVQDLLAANDITDKNLIVAGQTLRLPEPAAGNDGDTAKAAAAADTPQTPAKVIAVAAVGSGTAPVAVPALASTAAPVKVLPLAAALSPADAGALSPRAAPDVAANDDGVDAAVADGGVVDSAAANSGAGTFDSSDDLDSGNAGNPADSDAAAAGGSADVGGSPDTVAADSAADSNGDQSAAGNDDSSLDSNALASNQSGLAADPSDYSVADDGTITVQSLETLGHYADWLEIRTQRLRDINGLPFRRAVVIGQTLKLDFSNVTPEKFEERRTAYHEQLQEDFFTHYRIDSVDNHVVRRG
ncbi:MAG TPA: LysM peptidoglycan-binding domain-containing protein, partial [Gammaproteobacteria bacterium]|nr:LysM peptidoglycan-binding domain-containing protein [Gammaproteobacteria bacterium]